MEARSELEDQWNYDILTLLSFFQDRVDYNFVSQAYFQHKSDYNDTLDFIEKYLQNHPPQLDQPPSANPQPPQLNLPELPLPQNAVKPPQEDNLNEPSFEVIQQQEYILQQIMTQNKKTNPNKQIPNPKEESKDPPIMEDNDNSSFEEIDFDEVNSDEECVEIEKEEWSQITSNEKKQQEYIIFSTITDTFLNTYSQFDKAEVFELVKNFDGDLFTVKLQLMEKYGSKRFQINYPQYVPEFVKQQREEEMKENEKVLVKEERYFLSMMDPLKHVRQPEPKVFEKNHRPQPNFNPMTPPTFTINNEEKSSPPSFFLNKDGVSEIEKEEFYKNVLGPEAMKNKEFPKQLLDDDLQIKIAEDIARDNKNVKIKQYDQNEFPPLPDSKPQKKIPGNWKFPNDSNKKQNKNQDLPEGNHLSKKNKKIVRRIQKQFPNISSEFILFYYDQLGSIEETIDYFSKIIPNYHHKPQPKEKKPKQKRKKQKKNLPKPKNQMEISVSDNLPDHKPYFPKRNDKADDYDEIRKVANQHMECMKRFRAAAKNARSVKSYEDASYYQNQADYHQAQYEIAKREAMENTIMKKNNERDIFNRIDLHNLHKDEALQFTEKILTHLEQEIKRGARSAHSIRIVTGVGIHSKGKPVLRPAIKDFLIRRRYKFKEERGAFIEFMQSKKFNRKDNEMNSKFLNKLIFEF